MNWKSGYQKLNGTPPEEYQCRANRRNGKRCRKWALRTSDYCQFHGGRLSKRSVGVQTLPKFYRRHLGPTLESLFVEQLERDPSEQLSLLDELAMVRIVADDAVASYAAAKKVEDTKKRNGLVATASVLMSDALGEVARVCEAASRVEAAGRNKFDVMDLRVVLAQVMRVMQEVCGDEHASIAVEFERKVRDRVRAPNAVLGTDVTPDLDLQIAAMDAATPTVMKPNS